MDVFRHLNRDEGQTIVIVTHDVALSKQVQRVIAIRDGKFSSERVLKEQYSIDSVEAAAVNWQEEETQEEFTIIDRAGRIQIPRELLAEAGIEDNKLRMEVRDGKIVLEKA